MFMCGHTANDWKSCQPAPPAAYTGFLLLMLTGRPQVDFAVAQILESGDHAQRGRLAAAAGTQEGEAFALFDGQD